MDSATTDLRRGSVVGGETLSLFLSIPLSLSPYLFLSFHFPHFQSALYALLCTLPSSSPTHISLLTLVPYLSCFVLSYPFLSSSVPSITVILSLVLSKYNLILSNPVIFYPPPPPPPFYFHLCRHHHWSPQLRSILGTRRRNGWSPPHLTDLLR